MDLPEVLANPTRLEAWRLGESELVAVTGAVSQYIVECEALRVRLVADLEGRGSAKAAGAASTAAWLSGMSRMAPGAATGIVKLGQALADWPDTAAALGCGAINVGHAKVIVGFFAGLPAGVPAAALPECERYLLDAAGSENPVELQRRAAALRHLLEPVEDSLPDAENVELNEFHAATTLGGRGMVNADLDAETMEMLLSALSALSAPQPGADGRADRRSAARRRADAFTELLRRYLNSGESPVEGYERPHLSLLIHAADLATDTPDGDTTEHTVPGDTAGDTAPGDAAPEGAAQSVGESAGQAANNADEPESEQEQEQEQEPAEPAAAAEESGPAQSSASTQRPAPDRGAYEALFGAARPGTPGWMPWLGPISARSARRIACDCELTAILLDDAGVPLNLGRTQRLVSHRQRRALIARDHGCAFPGRGRPPAWVQAHHIRHWIDGGATDLANLVLVCAHHHRVIHHNGWDVIMGEDGHPWFLPPAWLDPLRQPRPAHHRQYHPHPSAA